MVKKAPGRIIVRLFVLFAFFVSVQAHAVLTIDITRGAKSAIPIAIVPFGVSPSQILSESIWDVVSADLARSGRFEPLPESDMLSKPASVKQVRYKDWRLLKMNAIVIGNVQQLGTDQYEVSFRLLDVFNETQMAGNKYVVKSALFRKVAHKISDIIYHKLTGIPGAFDTKIAYVMQEGVKKNARYMLQISDADGYRPVTIWNPDTPLCRRPGLHRLISLLTSLSKKGARKFTCKTCVPENGRWSLIFRELTQRRPGHRTGVNLR